MVNRKADTLISSSYPDSSAEDSLVGLRTDMISICFAGNNYTQLLGDHRIASLADLLAGPDTLGQPSARSAIDILEAELAASRSGAQQMPSTMRGSKSRDTASQVRDNSNRAAQGDAEPPSRNGRDDSLGEVNGLTRDAIEAEAARQRALENAKYGPGRFSDRPNKSPAAKDREGDGST